MGLGPKLLLNVIEFADAVPVNATMQPAIANAIKELFFRFIIVLSPIS